jgi:hypothetical protein
MKELAVAAAFALSGVSCSGGQAVQPGIDSGGLQPGIGVSRSGEDLFVHIAPCMLAFVKEITLSEHTGGSRLPVGLPIYWQIRRMEGATDPPANILAGETPGGFVATVPFTPPPVLPNARHSVLIDLSVADVGSMSFQLQEEPGGSDVPSDGSIYIGEYRRVSRSAFDATDACDPHLALVDDGTLSTSDAEAFAPASNPLADPHTTQRVLLDLASTQGTLELPSQQRIGTFEVSEPYKIYAACSGTSIQVSEAFSPAPDRVWGQRTVVPCRGGWTPEALDQPRPGTPVTVMVVPEMNTAWHVVAVIDSD